MVHVNNCLSPSGESIDITFDVYVNLDAVAGLQSGLSPLTCIIVLTLVGGKDYFVTISGRFIPTSFGLPLSLLLRLPDTPVAMLPPDELKLMVGLIFSPPFFWLIYAVFVSLDSRLPSR